jgi:hypothetical protein
MGSPDSIWETLRIPGSPASFFSKLGEAYATLSGSDAIEARRFRFDLDLVIITAP